MVTINRSTVPKKRNGSTTIMTMRNFLLLLMSVAVIVVVGLMYLTGTKFDESGVLSSGRGSGGLDAQLNSFRGLTVNNNNNIHDGRSAQQQGQQQQGQQQGQRHDGNQLDEIVYYAQSTENGFFSDFAKEREDPPYRHGSIPDWDELEKRVAKLLSADRKGLGVGVGVGVGVAMPSLRSCQYLGDDGRLLQRAKCRQDVGTTSLVAYNPLSFPRFWCGRTIAPLSAVEVTLGEGSPLPCQNVFTNMVFPVPVGDEGDVKTMTTTTTTTPVDGKGMPPILIQSKKDEAPQNVEEVSCDIPCVKERDLDGGGGTDCDDDSDGNSLPLRYIAGTEWKIIRTFDDPARRHEVVVERNAFRRDLYYSTTSFKSSVPLSCFQFDKHDIFTPSVNFDDLEDSASYLVNSACNSPSTRRQRWAGSVDAKYKVAYYGKCNHNTDLPPGLSMKNKDDRLALRRRHKFDLAFEYGDSKDRITSLVFESFESGTVPVVLGAGNVKDHFPPHSFVSAGDFQTWELLSQYLVALSKNKTEWESYHAWRKNPRESRAVFEKRYNFTRTSDTCRLCRWAYAKRYGLGWDHQQQMVRDNVIPRKLCLDQSTRLVNRPFHESWYSRARSREQPDEYADPELLLEAEPANAACASSSSEQSISGDIRLHRTVAEHDGVIEFAVTNLGSSPPRGDGADGGDDIILRMKFPVRNREGAYFQDVHSLIPNQRSAMVSSIAIQDRKSKITILTNWVTRIWSPSEGLVEIVVRDGGGGPWHEGDEETRRIRIIVEDLNPVNDKMTEFYPSSFGKMMVQDFVDPIELFHFDE